MRDHELAATLTGTARIRVGPKPANMTLHPSLLTASTATLHRLLFAPLTAPLDSSHEAACNRVLKTSNGNVACWTNTQSTAAILHDPCAGRQGDNILQASSPLTTHAVTPARPPAVMSSGHPRLPSSSSASSISDS